MWCMQNLPDASTLFFERTWTFWVKLNNTDWDINQFYKCTTLKTIKDMWSVLNNIDDNYPSCVNIFIMENDRIPLVENNGNTFIHGGLWSVVIKRNNWKLTLREVVLALVGELEFSDSVKGVCVIPVTTSHVIVKLWSVDRNEIDGTTLESLFPNTKSRFKPFDI